MKRTTRPRLPRRPTSLETARAVQKAETRARIVRAAAAAIRQRGYAGAGVAEVMADAGLTHGGFYAHFESRDALLAEAAGAAGADGIGQLARIAQAAPAGHGLAALVDSYLSDRHVERAERGCPLVAAGSELPRQSAEVRRAATERIKEMVDLVERHGPAWGEAAGHESALAQLSCMVGAMIIARAVDEPALAAAVRNAARASVTGKRR